MIISRFLFDVLILIKTKMPGYTYNSNCWDLFRTADKKRGKIISQRSSRLLNKNFEIDEFKNVQYVLLCRADARMSTIKPCACLIPLILNLSLSLVFRAVMQYRSYDEASGQTDGSHEATYFRMIRPDRCRTE